MASIVPVILSGGSGTRLWPLSRQSAPKQLLPLTSARTLLQDTALRVIAADLFLPPVIIGNGAYADMVEAQLTEIGLSPLAHVLEPFGRNTAPATAVAALVALKNAPDALVLLLPADHHIGNPEALLDAVRAAKPDAEAGRIVTFGIVPGGPETGYGYIQRGARRPGAATYEIAKFVEKPNLATAQSYLASGDFYWNSGMFLASAQGLLDEMTRLCPDVAVKSREALARAETRQRRIHLDAEAFGACPNISLDYAVMEHTARGSVLPVPLAWNDVGSWAALWDLAEKDSAGNATRGDALLHDSRGTYVRAESRLVAVVGVEDLVVIETPDAVLVAPRHRVQDVKAIVDRLKAQKRSET